MSVSTHPGVREIQDDKDEGEPKRTRFHGNNDKVSDPNS